MKIRWYILFFLLLIYVSCSSLKESKPENKIVSGIVINENTPLPGAFIEVKNTKRIIASDVYGKFEISVNKNDKLIVSYVGLEPKQVTITDENHYEINLEEAIPFVSRKEKRMIRRELRKNGFYIYPD